MLTVDEIEAIRSANYCEQQSIRAIAREAKSLRYRLRCPGCSTHRMTGST
jgi:hypothetical protein